MGVACSWSSAPGIVRYLKKKKKLPRNHNRTIYDNMFQLNPQSGENVYKLLLRLRPFFNILNDYIL